MYPHQSERLTDALERAGLEALVATSSANLAYVAGIAGPGDTGPKTRGCAVFARQGTALALPAMAIPSAVMDEVEVDHIVCFGDFPAEISERASGPLRRLPSILEKRAAGLPEALGLALDRLGVRGGAVGVDGSGLASMERDQLPERLLAFTIVNGTDILAGARRVKAPFEIECLLRALGIAEEALNEVIQTLARGTTEREAAAAFRAEVVKRGAAPYRVLISMGERTSLPMAWPTDRALRSGELVRFEVGCVNRGYHACVARTAVLGEPTAEHDVRYGALLAGVEAAMDRTAPGCSAGDIATAARGAVHARGLARYQYDPVGHGIGLEPCEPPALAQGDATTLEAGEVLQIAMPLFEVGSLGFGVTETVLVATRGARLLNRSARGLVTLD